jgi:phosphatidylinositol alpha-1,6-mannosyltransferase
MDVLIDAASRLSATRPDLTVAIAGSGRDHGRLARLVAASAAPVRLLGRVPDEDLPRLYACADVFAMLCRDRWAGLEQEGFGIVFLEAAACAVPQVAGDSGGAAEAVLEGATGLVVRRPRDHEQAARTLAPLLDDEGLRRRLGRTARRRVEASFDYQTLATRLEVALGKLAD